MKTFSICLFVIAIFLNARGSDATSDIQIFQQLQLCIQKDILDEGKELPASFESLASLREILKENSQMIQHLNKFAIVPGIPIIKPAESLSLDLAGSRIFATCRTSNLQPSRIGRLVLLATSNGSSVFPYWIPEPQFQIILEQLKGFDPAKQPLVFQDLAKGDTKKAAKQKSSNDTKASVNYEQHPLSAVESSAKLTSKNASDSYLLLISGGIIAFLSVIGYVIFQKRCKAP